MKIDPSVFEKVITDLLAKASEERKKTEPYKDMFEASQHGLRGLLDDANSKMERIILDVAEVIEERTGANISKEMWVLLRCLPLIQDQLQSHISKTEGFSCCADKMREIICKYALDQQFSNSNKAEG